MEIVNNYDEMVRKETYYFPHDNLKDARDEAVHLAREFQDFEGTAALYFVESAKKSILLWIDNADTCLEGLEKEASLYVSKKLIEDDDLVYIQGEIVDPPDPEEFGILPYNVNSVLFQTSQLK